MTDFLPRPELAPPGVWSFPTPTRTRLDNGIETVVFQLPGQHVVVGPPGAGHPAERRGPRDCEGVATICARVLDEGTRQHDGEEFAELLETEGAGFGIERRLAGLQAVLDVPVSHLDRALELFAEAVREPSLADRDVNRHVQLRLAEIEQAQANSAQTASIAFRSAVFDAASPGLADERRRAGDGRPGRPARRWRPSTPITSARPGRTLILAGDFRTDPVAAGRALLRRLAEPAAAGGGQPQAPAPRPPADCCWSTGRARCRPTSASAASASTGSIRAGPTSPWPATRWAGRSCPG